MRKLIEMQQDDGSKLLVGVDVPADPDEIRQIGVLNFFKGNPESLNKSFDALSEMILRYSKPIVASFEQIGTENVPLKKATAEFGLSFTGTGNIYLVEASTGANIKVSLEWSLKD
jgi:hypothetical protein